MNRKPESFIRRLHHEESGQVLILGAISLVTVLGFSAFVVDIGFLVYAQRTLQASADAAAAAGAQDLPDDTKAANSAVSYSAGTSGYNKKGNLPTVTVTSASTCNAFLATQSLPCVTLVNKRAGAPTTANLFTVTQQVTVPMFFAQVIGVPSISVTAVAKAGMRGGQRALNVFVVVDTTQSMANSDSGCGTTGVSPQDKLDCAKLGVRTILGCGTASGPCNLDQSVDSVGLMVFPGLKAATPLTRDYNCAADLSASDVAAYNASPVYLVVPLLNNFRTGMSLNGGSNLVKAVDFGDGAGCGTSNYGLENPGGQGTYYGGAIAAAQAAFPVGTGKQNVIILLSDGDASAGTGPSNQCQTAVTNATTAAATGTWVYSIAYGAGSSGCSTDSGAYRNACYAMQHVAQSKGVSPDSNKFYSDNVSCASSNSMTKMDDIFASIGRDLTTTRLIP